MKHNKINSAHIHEGTPQKVQLKQILYKYIVNVMITIQNPAWRLVKHVGKYLKLTGSRKKYYESSNILYSANPVVVQRQDCSQTVQFNLSVQEGKKGKGRGG